jgi:hypothetical protein
LNKKRRLSENNSTSASNKKKHKTSSKPPASHNSNGQGTSPSSPKTTNDHTSRPKRGLQQLKERNSNKITPYREKLEYSSNPVGHNVSYVKNPHFKLNSVKSKKDKQECAGQAFTVQLNKRQGWNVKATSNDGFVLFKNCNMCISSEQSAKEGRDKFTGYRKVAKFVYKNRKVAELVKGSTELKDILQSLRLSITDEDLTELATPPNVQNTTTTDQPSEEHVDNSVQNATAATCQQHANPTVPIQTGNNNPTLTNTSGSTTTSADELNVVDGPDNGLTESVIESTSQSDYNSFLKQLNELKQLKQIARDKLAHARTTYIEEKDVFKRDASVKFYNAINNCMLKMAKSCGTTHFKLEPIQNALQAFEDYITDLTKSEEESDESDIEFYKDIIESLVDKTKTVFSN